MKTPPIPPATVTAFTDWLINTDNQLTDFPGVFDSFVKLLNSFGLDIARCNIGVRAFHPQIEAIAYQWNDFTRFHEPPATNSLNMKFYNLGDAVVVENTLRHGSMGSDAFKNSPIARIVRTKAMYRYRYADKDPSGYEYVILEDLEHLDPTDYIALPFSYNEGQLGFCSIVSCRPGALTDEQVSILEFGMRIFAVKFESYIQHVITDNLLQLYLGRVAGKNVLNGRVHRGDVETIESVIWFSDIRNFTALTAQNDARVMVGWLNDYFDAIIGMIHEYGGEVLKFLGDGLLAVFPAPKSGKIKQTKYKSLLCARDACRTLSKLNRERAEDNLPPLEHGIGLHYGVVEYGNIGAGTRLDFTVIGDAVNKASRIASLCSSLDAEVLISDNLTGQLALKFQSRGEFALKGLEGEHGVLELKVNTLRLPRSKRTLFET